MGKSRKRARSGSKERSESPVLSKRQLQEQINAIAKIVAELAEAQKAAINSSQTVPEPQKGKIYVP